MRETEGCSSTRVVTLNSILVGIIAEISTITAVCRVIVEPKKAQEKVGAESCDDTSGELSDDRAESQIML